MAFGITLLLAAFVSFTAFSVARDRLADRFAGEQYLASLQTARYLRTKYDLAGLCLHVLARESRAPTRLLDNRDQLSWFRILLDQAPLSFVQVSDQGEIVGHWPEPAELPPAETLAAAWDQARRTLRPRPSFYVNAAGESRMLMVEVRDRKSARSHGVGVVLDVTRLLEPPSETARRVARIHLVEPATLEVVAGNQPLTPGVNIKDLYRTPSNQLFEAMGRAEGGQDRLAVREATAGAPASAHLLGMQGLDLGGRKLVVVTAAPRKDLVETYLTSLFKWIGLIGVVMVLGLVSFVVLVLQSNAAAKVERRRAEERSSLLKISHALLYQHNLEEVLKCIADEARMLFRAEGATIALVDDETDEIVFRTVSSRSDEVVQQLRGLRLPKDQGVLGWVVSRGEPVLVDNAAKDERFSTNVDEKTGGHTMSLLCAPLMDQKGSSFGAIELVNNLENPFPESDLTLLQSLAVTASAAVERAMFIEREHQQERLRREMEIAQTVQQGLLPKTFPTIPGYEVHGASTAAREVGGDFYDIIPVSDGHYGIVIADVADKGLGAAMFMVMCRSLLYSCAQRQLSPSKVLAELNAQILEFSTSDMFVTVFYGVLDTAARTLTYCNAGHNPPAHFRAAGESIELITTAGMALGVIDDISADEASLELGPNDRVLLYTDGITEAIDPAEEQFGIDRLRDVLCRTRDEDAEQTVRHVLDEVNEFAAGQPQFDDMTLLVVRAGQPSDRPEDWLRDARTRG